MSIEETIIANIAKQMQVDIDQEILDSLILEDVMKMGWTKTTLGIYSHTVSKWLRENIKGEFKVLHGKLWFEDGQDAVLFMLRWS